MNAYKSLICCSIVVVIERLERAEQKFGHELEVQALLGGAVPPSIKLADFLSKLFEFTKGTLWNKSDDQIRKWKNPRILAMQNFIRIIENKDAKNLTKDDMLKYRDWWLYQIQDRTVKPETANKNIIHVKNILATVSDHMNPKLDIAVLFKKLTFKCEDEKVRLPFETGYILNTLLNPQNIGDLNQEARAALFVFAETGIGTSEIAGLLPECISAWIQRYLIL